MSQLGCFRKFCKWEGYLYEVNFVFSIPSFVVNIKTTVATDRPSMVLKIVYMEIQILKTKFPKFWEFLSIP